MPSTNNRRAVALIAAVTGALFVSACGGSSPTPPVPSASQNPADAAFKNASCMRQHGVPSFPDPKVVSTPGHQSIAMMVPRSLVDSPQFRAAQKACKAFAPGPGNGNPAETAQQQHAREQHLLAFARCMRSHNVRDFPDPNPRGQVTPEMVNAAGVDLHAPSVLAAARTCVPSAGGAVTRAQIQHAASSGN
jgi:hypothetical protein